MCDMVGVATLTVVRIGSTRAVLLSRELANAKVHRGETRSLLVLEYGTKQ